MPDINKLPTRPFSPSSSQDSIIKVSADEGSPRRASLSLEPVTRVSQDGRGPVFSASTPARLCELEPAVTKASEIMDGGSNEKPTWRRYAGILFTLLASICFSLSVILIKTLNKYDPLSIAVFRFGGVIVPIVPIVIYYECRGVRVFRSIWPLTQRQKLMKFVRLTACGMFGCSGKLFQLYSLNFITVGDSSAVAYASPVCVVILAHFFLKEKCGLVSIIVALTTCFGVFVITRPPAFTGAASFDTNTLIGTALASLSMLGNASSYIFMRELRDVHFALLNITFTFWGVSEALGASLTTGVLKLPEGLHDSIVIYVVLPTLVFLGQFTLTLALKFENAGPVALVRTTDVLFSFCWQFIFLGVIPDIFSATGAAIVVLGVLITGVRKLISELPADDVKRKRLRFLLL